MHLSNVSERIPVPKGQITYGSHRVPGSGKSTVTESADCLHRAGKLWGELDTEKQLMVLLWGMTKCSKNHFMTVCVLVFPARHKLELPGRKDPPLGNCHRQIGMRTHLRALFLTDVMCLSGQVVLS